MIKLKDLLTETLEKLDEKEIKLDKPNEFKQHGPRKVEYRGHTITKSAYQWYIQNSSKVDGLRDGSYMGLSFALKDIDKLYD